MPKPLRPLTPDLSPAHRLGAALRAKRLAKHHTQRSLGDVVHVSTSMIGAIETGDRISTFKVIKACDDELGAEGELCILWRAAARSRRPAGRPAMHAVTPASTTAAHTAHSSFMERAIEHVERVWSVRLNRATTVRGFASIGAATNRSTWIRIERAQAEQVGIRGWGGAEAVVAVRGVAAPAWINSLTWRGEEPEVVWRADEIELVDQPTIATNPVLIRDPGLSPAWWSAWGRSMDALADATTTRIAVARRQLVTAEHVANVIDTAWPGRVEVRIAEWACAHGEMTWRKLTSPACWIVGWDGFGLAPRGLDAATLWCHSLAVPEVASRIWRERRADLESPTGTILALFCLAHVRDPTRARADPLYSLAGVQAARLLSCAPQAA